MEQNIYKIYTTLYNIYIRGICRDTAIYEDYVRAVSRWSGGPIGPKISDDVIISYNIIEDNIIYTLEVCVETPLYVRAM